jgi:hypothetical protein
MQVTFLVSRRADFIPFGYYPFTEHPPSRTGFRDS